MFTSAACAGSLLPTNTDKSEPGLSAHHTRTRARTLAQPGAPRPRLSPKPNVLSLGERRHSPVPERRSPQNRRSPLAAPRSGRDTESGPLNTQQRAPRVAERCGARGRKGQKIPLFSGERAERETIYATRGCLFFFPFISSHLFFSHYSQRVFPAPSQGRHRTRRDAFSPRSRFAELSGPSSFPRSLPPLSARSRMHCLGTTPALGSRSWGRLSRGGGRDAGWPTLPSRRGRPVPRGPGSGRTRSRARNRAATELRTCAAPGRAGGGSGTGGAGPRSRAGGMRRAGCAGRSLGGTPTSKTPPAADLNLAGPLRPRRGPGGGGEGAPPAPSLPLPSFPCRPLSPRLCSSFRPLPAARPPQPPPARTPRSPRAPRPGGLFFFKLFLLFLVGVDGNFCSEFGPPLLPSPRAARCRRASPPLWATSTGRSWSKVGTRRPPFPPHPLSSPFCAPEPGRAGPNRTALGPSARRSPSRFSRAGENPRGSPQPAGGDCGAWGRGRRREQEGEEERRDMFMAEQFALKTGTSD